MPEHLELPAQVSPEPGMIADPPLPVEANHTGADSAQEAETEDVTAVEAREPGEERQPQRIPLEDVESDDAMAAFRQAARKAGWTERETLLKEVSLHFGHQRLGSRIEAVLRGHLRAAIRRRIIEVDQSLVRLATNRIDEYSKEELRDVFRSVLKPRRQYEREEVTAAAARYLGFVRITNTVRETIKSAINSAIRQGLLDYDGTLVWRVK